MQQTEKQFPNFPDVEHAVLGALIIEKDAIGQVIDYLHPELFYTNTHKAVCQAILSLYDKQSGIDMITVTQELAAMGLLEVAGGAYTIAMLTTNVESGAHVQFHTALLADKYLQRLLMMYSLKLLAKSGDETLDVGETLEFASNEIDLLCRKVFARSKIIPMHEAIGNAREHYEERERRFLNGNPIGVPSGLESLDDLTGGWQPTDLIIVAARPGMGKTAFMLHCARMASASEVPVVIFSLEMTNWALADRMALSQVDLPMEDFRNGRLAASLKERLYMAYDNTSVIPISIDESSMINVREIRSRAAELQRRGKCGMIMIDYLQLMGSREENRGNSREQQIASITPQIKVMAKELNVPVILLSQLSRNSENRNHHKPILSDLRESGAIEQDADMVIFLHRPEYYTPEDKDLCGMGSLSIAKNRHGPASEINIRYNKSITRFFE